MCYLQPGYVFSITFFKHVLISAHQYDRILMAGEGQPPQEILSIHHSQERHHLQRSQWTQRPGYRWTQSNEVSLSKEVLDQIQATVPSNRTDDLLFVGVFCRKEDWIARTLIRQTSMSLAPPGVVVKFVVCHQENSGFDPSIWAEMRQHQDLYLIDCVENMNEGKSFGYFTTVRRDFPGFSYYSKADTDTYILFHDVARALDVSPRCLFYGGLSNGDRWPVGHLSNYMSGSFYILSSDLLLKLEGCHQACAVTDGPEDVMIAGHLWRLVGEEIQYGDFGSNHSLYYDRQAKDTEILPRHVLLHPLKTPQEWWHVHKAMIIQINAKEVERAEREYFWDGPYTTIRLAC